MRIRQIAEKSPKCVSRLLVHQLLFQLPRRAHASRSGVDDAGTKQHYSPISGSFAPLTSPLKADWGPRLHLKTIILISSRTRHVVQTTSLRPIADEHEKRDASMALVGRRLLGRLVTVQ